MPSVKDLNITYDNVLNEEGTFSGGDLVTGRVTFQLEKETKVKSVVIKLKGDAHAWWGQPKQYGIMYTNNKYHSSRRYFKLREFLVTEDAEEVVLPKGTHVYNFSFKIPVGNMPPSFSGEHGNIVYMLEAKLARSWRPDCVARRELTLVNKSIPASAMSPQVGAVEKELGTFFSKGRVQMEASVNSGACCPGEEMTVVAKVNNSSSRPVKPKFKLFQTLAYRVDRKTERSETEVCRAAGDVVEPDTSKTITCQLLIPVDQSPTVDHCDIISLHYHVRAYLDISFDFDPEVNIQMVMLPAGSTSRKSKT